MAVFRVNKTENYTLMSNRHFKEKEMSLKAKGLLSLMLSLPNTWDYSISGLVAICKENESAVKSALNELKKFGYLKITKEMPNNENGGRIKYVYDVFENPIQEHKKQEVENQPLEILSVENKGQLNTNNKELNNKTLKNKDILYIVNYLNEKANTNFRATTASTKRHISARMNEGFTIDDFKIVIDKKVSQWLNDKNMNKYLRPEILFGTKFEAYLNEKWEQPKKATEVKDDFDLLMSLPDKDEENELF